MNHPCSTVTQQTRVGGSHRGISLLEIMISIGIVGIGLIGVASLIPLAHYKATEGVREERKALFGKRAYREFFVQGFDRPGSFTSAGQGAPYWVWLGGQNPYDIYNGATGQVIPQTYCFDPHWVAARQALPQPIFSRTFPEVGPAAALVPRISVLTHRPEILRESVILQGGQPIVASNVAAGFVANPRPMSFARADEIFRIRDDVVVEPPDNPNDIAQQTYLSESTSPSTPPLVMKRLSGGGFSWMATLTPELTSTFNPINPAVAVPYVANRYKLSIVIFNQRNLLSNYAEEVVAEVVPPPSTLLTGAAKDIVIRELGTSPPIVENVGVRHIRAGDWIALMQKLPLPPPQLAFTRLQWYQVMSTDEQDTDTTILRQLSLSGPDWNPVWDANFPIYAIYLRNVETVYEKTVELQQ